jgi:hypothetical protein
MTTRPLITIDRRSMATADSGARAYRREMKDGNHE